MTDPLEGLHTALERLRTAPLGQAAEPALSKAASRIRADMMTAGFTKAQVSVIKDGPDLTLRVVPGPRMRSQFPVPLRGIVKQRINDVRPQITKAVTDRIDQEFR